MIESLVLLNSRLFSRLLLLRRIAHYATRVKRLLLYLINNIISPDTIINKFILLVCLQALYELSALSWRYIRWNIFITVGLRTISLHNSISISISLVVQYWKASQETCQHNAKLRQLLPMETGRQQPIQSAAFAREVHITKAVQHCKHSRQEDRAVQTTATGGYLEHTAIETASKVRLVEEAEWCFAY